MGADAIRRYGDLIVARSEIAAGFIVPEPQPLVVVRLIDVHGNHLLEVEMRKIGLFDAYSSEANAHLKFGGVYRFVSEARVNRRLVSFLLGSAGVAAFLAILELLPDVGVVDPQYLPPTSAIFNALLSLVCTQVFWLALGNTLLTWSIGLAVVTIAGGLLGTLVGSVPLLRNVTNSTVEFLRPIPSVALVPVVILLLGTGRAATLILVV